MYNLKSEFSKKETIVIPLIIFVIVTGIILVMGFVTHKMILEGEPIHKTTIWPVLLFGIFNFYSIYYHLKTFKVYRFTVRGINVSNVFSERFYSWKEVKEINVVGKELETVLFITVVEDGSRIYLDDDKDLIILTKYYTNMSKIRRLLVAVNDDLFLKTGSSFENKNIKEEQKQNLNDLESEKRTFKGNHIFTFNMLIAYCWLFFGVLIFIYRYTSMTIAGGIFLVGFPIVLLYLNGFRLYYFQLENDFLIIKNHLPFFYDYNYRISDLKQIHIELNSRKANGLRVITKDYDAKFFMGDSLWDRHWKELIRELREKGVEVKDELFFGDY